MSTPDLDAVVASTPTPMVPKSAGTARSKLAYLLAPACATQEPSTAKNQESTSFVSVEHKDANMSSKYSRAEERARNSGNLELAALIEETAKQNRAGGSKVTCTQVPKPENVVSTPCVSPAEHGVTLQVRPSVSAHDDRDSRPSSNEALSLATTHASQVEPSASAADDNEAAAHVLQVEPSASAADDNEGRSRSNCASPRADETLEDCAALEPVLGIKDGSRCAQCRTPDVERSRAFVELGHLYCYKCWTQWERCGHWYPTMRINNVRPEKTEDGVPLYGPEDAFSIPEFFCGHNDSSWFEKLKGELPEGRDFSDWHGGRHLGIQFEGEGARHDDEKSPPALTEAVRMLEEAFGIEAGASRINLYRSDADFKPMHCDRGRNKEGVPQVTVGASFGASRELTMMHIQTGITTTFPQRNGDVFAFTPELNTVFMHGVPLVDNKRPTAPRPAGESKERLSLILWGSRIHNGKSWGPKAGQVPIQ